MMEAAVHLTHGHEHVGEEVVAEEVVLPIVADVASHCPRRRRGIIIIHLPDSELAVVPDAGSSTGQQQQPQSVAIIPNVIMSALPTERPAS